MYAKRRSKNERKMVTSVSNNVDYKNPYCPQNEGSITNIEKVKHSSRVNVNLKINLRDNDINYVNVGTPKGTSTPIETSKYNDNY